jgi:hypothetical protein
VRTGGATQEGTTVEVCDWLDGELSVLYEEQEIATQEAPLRACVLWGSKQGSSAVTPEGGEKERTKHASWNACRRVYRLLRRLLQQQRSRGGRKLAPRMQAYWDAIQEAESRGLTRRRKNPATDRIACQLTLTDSRSVERTTSSPKLRELCEIRDRGCEDKLKGSVSEARRVEPDRRWAEQEDQLRNQIAALETGKEPAEDEERTQLSSSSNALLNCINGNRILNGSDC